MGLLYKAVSNETFRHAREAQRADALSPSEQVAHPQDPYCIYLFFNLESAFAMGHSILGLSRRDGTLETYSFFRRAHRIIAPAKVAVAKNEATFQQIRERSGWILQGIPADTWNEHMTCCIALSCSSDAFEGVRTYIRSIAAHPGTYGLITRNCIHICRKALHAGGIHLLDRKGRRFRTILPKRVFCEAEYVEGAHRMGAWKYWFPEAEPPDNPYRVRPIRIMRGNS